MSDQNKPVNKQNYYLLYNISTENGILLGTILDYFMPGINEYQPFRRRISVNQLSRYTLVSYCHIFGFVVEWR